MSADWVTAEIRASERRFASGGGLSAVRRLAEPSVIGFVGFREFFEPPEPQLLYGLLPKYWGRGLATEAATAACRFAFDRTTDDGTAFYVLAPRRYDEELGSHGSRRRVGYAGSSAARCGRASDLDT